MQAGYLVEDSPYRLHAVAQQLCQGLSSLEGCKPCTCRAAGVRPVGLSPSSVAMSVACAGPSLLPAAAMPVSRGRLSL